MPAETLFVEITTKPYENMWARLALDENGRPSEVQTGRRRFLNGQEIILPTSPLRF